MEKETRGFRDKERGNFLPAGGKQVSNLPEAGKFLIFNSSLRLSSGVRFSSLTLRYLKLSNSAGFNLVIRG